MAKPIIGGPDTSKPQVARAPSGGVMSAKPLPYSTPQGPTNQMQQGPGLHGDNHGCGMYGTNEHMRGSPGIGGKNKGNMGSQR